MGGCLPKVFLFAKEAVQIDLQLVEGFQAIFHGSGQERLKLHYLSSMLVAHGVVIAGQLDQFNQRESPHWD